MHEPNWKKELRNLAKGKVLFDEGMDRHTSSGVGGRADALAFRESAAEMGRLVAFLRAEGVQSFMPTPGSAATAMFWAGVNPDRPDERVDMPRTLAEKQRQHALLTEGVPDTREPRGGARGGRRR